MGKNRCGIAAGSLFRSTRRPCHQRDYRAGGGPVGTGEQLWAGIFAAALIGIGAGGEAAITTYHLHLFWAACAFPASTASPGPSTPRQERSGVSSWAAR